MGDLYREYKVAATLRRGGALGGRGKRGFKINLWYDELRVITNLKTHPMADIPLPFQFKDMLPRRDDDPSTA